jgi:hypothetical protein
MAIKEFTNFGSISHGTLLNSDLLPAFYDEARDRFPHWETQGREPIIAASRIMDVVAILDDYDDADAIDQIYRSNAVSDLVNDLDNLLGEDLPPFVYFGTHPGDCSDFGYWFDSDSFEQSAQDGETVKVAELPDHPKTFAFEHPDAEYVAVVSGHGNVTLYSLYGLQHWGSRRSCFWAVV